MRKVEGKEENGERKGKEEIKKKRKEKKRKGKKTNRLYVIKLGLNLINIERTYNFTSTYYLSSRTIICMGGVLVV